MGQVTKIPADEQLKELQKLVEDKVGIYIPITNIELTSGNLQNILYKQMDTYINYSAKNGICQIDFSLCVKANSSTSSDASSNGTSEALWIQLPVTLPTPITRARGQAIPVNSDIISSANIRVETDGRMLILINNYANSNYTWLQNSMCYIINE